MASSLLVAIDQGAYTFARLLAEETGWRASEIYRVYVSFVDEYSRTAVEQALALVAAHRLDGETFDETCARLGMLFDQWTADGRP